MTPSQLKSLRARLGLTQQQLAEALGVKQNTVARWEMGIRTISPTVVKLLATLTR